MEEINIKMECNGLEEEEENLLRKAINRIQKKRERAGKEITFIVSWNEGRKLFTEKSTPNKYPIERTDKRKDMADEIIKCFAQQGMTLAEAQETTDMVRERIHKLAFGKKLTLLEIGKKYKWKGILRNNREVIYQGTYEVGGKILYEFMNVDDGMCFKIENIETLERWLGEEVREVENVDFKKEI